VNALDVGLERGRHGTLPLGGRRRGERVERAAKARD
jgi:hypothetical protein